MKGLGMVNWAETSRLTHRLTEVRSMANNDAARAVRVVEESLEEVLGEESFYGLPNLTPDLRGQARFCGLRVNNAGHRGMNAWLPQDGQDVLALDSLGLLVWVRREKDLVVARRVADADIRSDLLEPFLAAVHHALELHLAKVELRSESHRRVSMLAARLIEALDGRE
jgi:hypothetical protein